MTLFGNRPLPSLLDVFAVHVALAQTVNSFEEVLPGTTLTHQYGAKGVHFHGATTYSSSAAHSGKNALYSVPPNVEAFSFPGPLVINFDTNQLYVSGGHIDCQWPPISRKC